MFLFCGLGNPGRDYANTRHNIGFMLADNIIDHYELVEVKKDKAKQLFSGNINGYKVYVLKPLTFMNLSGKTLLDIMNFYKISKNNTFVIHDDLDLELAKTKIKKGGGSGGHNGLASIDEYLGKEYNRIRIGINHPGQKDLVSNYVLDNFPKEEIDIILKKIKKITVNIDLVFNDIPLFLTRITKN